MALVDYGSGSESEPEDEVHAPKIIQEKKQAATKIGDFGLNNDKGSDDDMDFGKNTGTLLKLPSASENLTSSKNLEENELEEVVKPRDWEQQLAEKNKRKLEKRANKEKKKHKKEKKHMKEKKHKEKKVKKEEVPKKAMAKKKIEAFGALEALAAESDSGEEESMPKTEARPSTSVNSKSALLSMLPAPKTKSKPSFGQSSSGSSLLLPSTLKKTGPMAPVPKISPAPATSSLINKRKAESDDSDDDGVTDFFGLTSAPEPKLHKLNEPEIPLMAAGTGFESFGPSKPSFEEEMHPSQMYNYADVDPSELPLHVRNQISDEQAFNLLSRDETVQIGDRRTLHEITRSIVDVSVDQALGPNVKSDLLKGVTKASYLRDVQSLPTKKDTVERVARQKHQITYLAKLAVARDDALQDQWSASKNNKRMARQKYGF